MERTGREGVCYSAKNVEFLEATYQDNPYLPREQYQKLAEMVGCKRSHIQSWFTCRRARDENITPVRRFTLAQQEILETAYQKNQKPNITERKEIAEMMNIEEVKRVSNWFQRRRYLIAQNSNKKFNKSQRALLVAAYLKSRYPKTQEIDKMAEEMGDSADRIRSWFTNRRYLFSKYGWNDEQEKTVLAAYQETRNLRVYPKGPDFTPTTSEILENAFEINQRPTNDELENLHEKTNLGVARIDLWFDRKRRSTKKQASNEKLKSEEQWQCTLREAYEKNRYRTTVELIELADQIGAEYKRVRGYFLHRRSFDEEYLQNPIIRKMKKITTEELIALNEEYRKNKHPNRKEKGEIADRIGMKLIRVQNWYQQKRSFIREYEKTQNVLGANVIKTLQTAYEKNPRPSNEERIKLAKTVGLTRAQVVRWFLITRQKSEYAIPNTVLLTAKQKDILVNAHNKNPYPSRAEKKHLINLTGITMKRLNNWLRDARKRNNKKKKVTLRTNQENSDIKMEVVDVKIKAEQMDIELDDEDQSMMQ